ncbi:Zmat2 [Scenedesmus sp. PABB004]|nr:Zmat2 [Scenedesmus sp. PABB004]
MSKRGGKSGVDNTARRTWDREEFVEKAAEREKKAAAHDDDETALAVRKRKRLERDPLHQGLIVARSSLQMRSYEVNLGERLGKSQVIGLNTPLSQQAGYYCSVCDCVLRDSQSYLDHINGKYHNRALGMSMKVEASTVEQVKNRLQLHKEKAAAARPDDYLPDGIDRRLAEREAEEERLKAEKKEAKRAAKRAARDGDDDGGLGGADEDMMALMGFGGFGGGKKA